MPSQTLSAELAWIDPARRMTPAESLARIQVLCGMFPELHGAMLAVLGTHQEVPTDILAAAIKQFRRDTDSLTREDVAGLLVALANGGKQGFDAVLRTRKSANARSASSLHWVKD